VRVDVRDRSADPPSLIRLQEGAISTLLAGFGRKYSSSRYLASSCQLIKRQIEQQNVHARLAQESKEANFGVVCDQLSDAVFRHISCLGNTRHLE